MPTHRELPQFYRDYNRLNREEKRAFHAALDKFIEDLSQREGKFRSSLRVKPMRDAPNVWEMTWAGEDGRATFSYGEEVRSGEPHIIWRRIGPHGIFDSP